MSLKSERWNYLTDSEGKPIRPAPRELVGYTIQPVRETPTHALSRPEEATAEQEQRAIEHEELRQAFDSLTPEEREALWLHEPRPGGRTVQEEILPSEEETRIAAGWHLVRRDKDRGVVVVTKSFPKQLGYDEIGEQMKLSASQVHRRIVSANRKLSMSRCVHEPDANGWKAKCAGGPLRAKCSKCGKVMKQSAQRNAFGQR